MSGPTYHPAGEYVDRASLLKHLHVGEIKAPNTISAIVVRERGEILPETGVCTCQRAEKKKAPRGSNDPSRLFLASKRATGFGPATRSLGISPVALLALPTLPQPAENPCQR